MSVAQVVMMRGNLVMLMLLMLESKILMMLMMGQVMAMLGIMLL